MIPFAKENGYSYDEMQEMNFKHPLAGKTLDFDAKVVEVK
jgi:hypothetical protein